MTEQQEILNKIKEERDSQDAKWGTGTVKLVADLDHEAELVCRYYGVPTEGDAKTLCEEAADIGECTMVHVLVEEVSEAITALVEGSVEEQIAELVQVAAVAVKTIELIKRGR